MNQTIDVVIPAYNSAQWLPATLNSVLTQTHTDIKVYVVDDGSRDETEAFMRSVADKRVTYIKKKNGGVSSARNAGIKACNSRFIAFVDADDLWMSDKLEKQLAILESNPEVGMVYGHHYLIDENDVIERNLRIWKRGNLFNDLVNGNCIAGSASMVLIRRDILDKAGLFREDFANGEDWEMWMRIARICKIDFVPEIIASIRVHNNGAQQNIRKMTDCLVGVYDVMRQEFDLTRSQQRLLASYCLFTSAVNYYQLKDYKLARKTLFRLFRENPPAYRDMENWKLHIGLGIFAKIIATYSAVQAVAYIARLPFRVLRKILRLIRQGARFGYRALRYLSRKIGPARKQ